MNLIKKLEKAIILFDVDNHLFPNTITMSQDIYHEFITSLPTMFRVSIEHIITHPVEIKNPKYYGCEIRRVRGEKILEIGFIKTINLDEPPN